MSFIGKFFLLVLVLGFAELYLLVNAAQWMGFLSTLALCIFTGVFGGTLVRHQGLQTLRDIQGGLAQGQVPEVHIASGLVLLIVGAMLITPGFITDTFGFLMLVPPIRHLVAGLLVKTFKNRVTLHSFGSPPDMYTTQEEWKSKVIDVDPE